MEHKMRRSHLVLAFLIAPLAVSPGCGGGNTIWVTGKLLKGGTPYVPPKDQLVTITFISLEVQDPSGKAVQGGDAYQAEYDPANGTFSVPGPERHGIPPGKYRVAVTQKFTREAFEAAKEKIKKKGFDRETDMLENKYGPSTSPFIVQVNRSQEATIDLDRPTESATKP
jgi:hypothetical protein